jgi:hypothetical protein
MRKGLFGVRLITIASNGYELDRLVVITQIPRLETKPLHKAVEGQITQSFLSFLFRSGKRLTVRRSH